ncbi:phenylacetaldoxime dehydratase family protein [Actinosynnema mirum]|uniref:Phenylacetaldoxime dehydratase n=1 Tax=Actinosynnema mirum (strain ATCC 29888 / DSM 43827 / JCM 3225 / NBRC 14064 / NCIMB 13271 / NRRL B-12336 / IMRU 3971 / 101) TaxID=446462 RepID=C6WDR0_ACTMD|nr:phenylacetaldoxime dehydratase family protein [Actinosynnema mirum]ACU34055.1 Phenylacetaldoxime dehydratase [Actinosynnema mirum DSM 43827]
MSSLPLDDRATAHRPEGYDPRGGPGHEVRWSDDVTHLVVARFGVQTDDSAAGVKAIARVLELAAGESGPALVERVSDDDSEMAVCYWPDPEAHRAWWASGPVRDWWASLPVDGPIGHWHETSVTPVEQFETLYSAEFAAGPSRFAGTGPTNLHDYDNSTLDRMPATAHRDLRQERAEEPTTDLPPGESPRGRRVRLAEPSPSGLCWIRTAQEWSIAPDDQLASYRDGVEPAYRTAIAHLQDNPHDTGCLSARLVGNLDANGARAAGAEAVVWWRGIGDLLRWAHDHKTHQDILNGFWEHVIAKFGPGTRVRLWHEVHVLPEGALTAEYVNCHPGTGLLQTWPG